MDSMVQWRREGPSKPATPRGYRAYAIGDVHGRLDLLDQLLAMIERDNDERQPSKTLLVFLGDLIDRGPDSKGVIERLRTFRNDCMKPYFLAGNHEEVLLRVLAGERGVLQSWLQFGGAECLMSYGFDPSELDVEKERACLDVIKRTIPANHAQFIAGFGDTLSFGDYLFVHAGIRPGVELPMQAQSDLRWIRAPFLDDLTDHGCIVVHGHTINATVEERPNRIGIDTGAYRTNRLTAVAVEGDQRWFLATAE